MKNASQLSIVVAPVALLVLLLAATPGLAQPPAPVKADERSKAAKAKRLAEAFERNARILTVFDRDGKVVTTVGQRAIYNQGSVISPDGRRVAAVIFDQQKEVGDIWVFDVATGASTRITTTQADDGIRLPVWSPDSRRNRRTSGSWQLRARVPKSIERGAEELLYQYPGAGMVLSDWSKDGRFLSVFTSNLSGAAVYVLPLADAKERTSSRCFAASLGGATALSPDSHFTYRTFPTHLEEVKSMSGRSVHRRAQTPRNHGRCLMASSRGISSGGRTPRRCITWPPISP